MVLDTDTKDDGRALDETTPPSHRDWEAAAANNAQLTTANPGVVPEPPRVIVLGSTRHGTRFMVAPPTLSPHNKSEYNGITTITQPPPALQPPSSLQPPLEKDTYNINETDDETVWNIEVEEIELDDEDVTGTLPRYHHRNPPSRLLR